MFDRSTTILGPYFQREYISNKLAFTEQKEALMKKLIEMPCTIYFNTLTFLNCIKAATRNTG